ncbi:hypothetical protein B296_00033079 [Ensete ventricosum]|uniref:Uncharacterized protein n=1 Tax=Ensete ventricosum TaxID=4639 RepID=A0A426YWD6_ENSVE|nr:hypothetical protein B296_00033079 [Ensete ventricosum]
MNRLGGLVAKRGGGSTVDGCGLGLIGCYFWGYGRFDDRGLRIKRWVRVAVGDNDQFGKDWWCMREGNEEEGWPATANPHIGSARPRPRPPVRGRLAAARASPQGRPTSLAGVVARKGGRRRSQGQQPTRVAPVGATGYGQPIGATATRGHTRLRRGACKGLPPIEAMVSVARVAATWQGGRQLARAVVACPGATATAAQIGQEGLGHPFEKKDDLAPLNLKNFEDYPHL